MSLHKHLLKTCFWRKSNLGARKLAWVLVEARPYFHCSKKEVLICCRWEPHRLRLCLGLQRPVGSEANHMHLLQARSTALATPAPVSLAAAMARDAEQRKDIDDRQVLMSGRSHRPSNDFCEEKCRSLEQRISEERGRCSRLEEELKEAQRRLQEQQAGWAIYARVHLQL